MEIPLENEIIHDYNDGAVWIKTDQPDCSSSYIDEQEIILKDLRSTVNNLPSSSSSHAPILTIKKEDDFETTDYEGDHISYIKKEDKDEDELDEDEFFDENSSSYDLADEEEEGVVENDEKDNDSYLDGNRLSCIKKEEIEDIDDDEDDDFFDEDELSLDFVDRPLKEEKDEKKKNYKGGTESCSVVDVTFSPAEKKIGLRSSKRKIKASKRYSDDHFEILFRRRTRKKKKNTVVKHKLTTEKQKLPQNKFHNLLEKERRMALKDSFNGMQLVNPEIAKDTNISEIHILKTEEKEKKKKIYKEGTDSCSDVDVLSMSPSREKKTGVRSSNRKVKASRRYSEDHIEKMYNPRSKKKVKKLVAYNKFTPEERMLPRNEFHNLLEKKRRIALRESFIELQLVIPEIAKDTKLSKIHILNTALGEINDLTMEDKTLTKEIYALELEYRRLQKRLNQDIKRAQQRLLSEDSA